VDKDFPRILSEHESSHGPAVVQVRGALLVSSLQTLRDLGYFPRYSAKLPAALHDSVVYALASSWLPTELAMAHYGACDAMELDDAELEGIGERVSARIMGTFVATLLRGTRMVGADLRPVLVLQQFHRLWDRLVLGGSCTVRQTGPKDAVIEVRGIPMFRYRYFRMGYTSLIRGAGLIIGRTLYTRVLRGSDTGQSLSLSWV